MACEDPNVPLQEFLPSTMSPAWGRETMNTQYYLIINYNHMGILSWIVFGALVGWVASKVMNTDAQQGAAMNIVVGIVGAVVGGWIMSFFGQTSITGFDLYSFLVALLGAIVLIAIVQAVRKVA